MTPKKICYIVGARPQFIKHAPLSRELSKHFKEILIHTGQHYDKNLSQVFFKELNIPKPDYNLGIGSYSHGKQTGRMLEKVERVLLQEKPELIIVYGDTNSTLAGALAAKKLYIPVAHVEAGLRSYNQNMPEEVNRILTDHMSQYLFCPSKTSVNNLYKEGIRKNVFNTGDVMYDATLYNYKLAKQKSNILEKLNLESYSYLLATVHRVENTDNITKLREIILAFNKADKKVVFLIHPRTKKIIKENNIQLSKNVQVYEPVGYLDMLVLQKNSIKILTDSGGMQKEAYFLNVPCITLREETEWVETVEVGSNIIVGANFRKIHDGINNFKITLNINQNNIYGNGNASKMIAVTLFNNLL